MKRAADGLQRLKLGIAKPHVFRSKGIWRCFWFREGQYLTASCAGDHAGIENTPKRAYFLLLHGYQEIQG